VGEHYSIFVTNKDTIELSDGLPSYLEAELNYWVDTVRYFSPWSASLVDVVD
jgi:hypothetical protein